MDLIKIYKKNEIIKDYVNIYFDDEKLKYNSKKISYKILHIIGNGVYGVVYKADCLDNCSIVALKQTYQKNARIFKEIEIMKKLKHPNIVKLKHAFYTTTSNGVYVHMVMEYGNIDLATSLYYITIKDTNEIIKHSNKTTKNNSIKNNSINTNNIINTTTTSTIHINNNNINDKNNIKPNSDINNNINDNNNTNDNISDNNNKNNNHITNDSNNNNNIDYKVNNTHKNEDDKFYTIINEKCNFNNDDTKIELKNAKNKNSNNFNNVNEIDHQNKEKIISSYNDNNKNVSNCNNLMNTFHANVLNENINNICSCHNLSEYIKKNFLNQNQIKIYLYQLIRATLYLHSLCITHRDIKPQNILIFLNNSNNNISNKNCDNGKCVVCVQNSLEHKYIINNKIEEKSSRNDIKNKKINKNVSIDININKDICENIKSEEKIINDKENRMGISMNIENVNKKKNENVDLKNVFEEDCDKSIRSDYTYSNEENNKNRIRIDDLGRTIKSKKIKLQENIQRNDKKDDDSIFSVSCKKENERKKIFLEKYKSISFFDDKGNNTDNNNKTIKEKKYRSNNSRCIQLKNKPNNGILKNKINNLNKSFERIRKSNSMINLNEGKSTKWTNVNDNYIYATNKDLKRILKRSKTDISVSRINNNSNIEKVGNDFNDINNYSINNENNIGKKKKKEIRNQNLSDIDIYEQNNSSKTYMSSIMYKYIKLCDFNTSIKLKENYKYFSYVCSRYYRAPELLFGSNYYSQEIDTWSIGCVMGELILGKPLFLGDCASDQLVEIIKILGTPNDEDFLSFKSVYKNVKFPNIKPITLKKLINHNCSKDSIDLLSKLLQFNPKKRIKLCNALLHNYFDDIRNLKVFTIFNKQISSDNNFSLPYNTNCFNFTKEELLHYTVEERKILVPLEVRQKNFDEVKQYINMSLENFDKLYPNKIHLTC
ncbi:protein kinase 1, putative [Plasmodium gallinaceum]|uniref:Protein kinase 1, putative n=1 Tax=Plasmodium gallinaceum TaxID=5849 RepID=A0A1J1GM54_PLAGA|nr:protein kinase 1, putative [Plasmodium gallinaceum]CRG93436.1 protein kinase 1, putative [Plasmodium gallinaceum]